ncbi:hypothetical protein [Methylobacterium sp. WSM2598]|uniref:hypothetical protein n=1 Tax=Methylobacterium sp. WSM2598 TaxID=398261 RepID=UPI000A00E9CE|nr:hypothetical protein [Methylobacterium sp. WSM2598]
MFNRSLTVLSSLTVAALVQLTPAVSIGNAQASPLGAAVSLAGQTDTASLHEVQWYGHHRHHRPYWGGWGYHHHHHYRPVWGGWGRHHYHHGWGHYRHHGWGHHRYY